jgi:membrane associated rhomboid family serine protease
VTDHPAGGPGDGDAAAGSSEPTTCYRHPDREAHIRCARCNRRICPDCMINASVGFQCPECVREGNQGVRRAQTVFGGRVSGDPGYVTKALIAVNALVFLAQQVIGSEVDYRFALVGRNFDSLGQGIGVAEGQPYRLLTAAFLHGNFLHLAMNMLLLFILGTQLEAELGRVRYAALYLISALGGSAASYAFNPPPNFSLGASGAVFGLLGAFLVVNRRLGRDSSGLFVLLGINLVLGFSVSGIDWRAHLGGLLAGALCAVTLVYAPRERRSVVQGVGLVAVLVLVLAGIAWRTAQLT